MSPPPERMAGAPPRLAILSYSTGDFDARAQRIARSAADVGGHVTIYARWKPGLPEAVEGQGYRIVRVATDTRLAFPGMRARARRRLTARILAERAAVTSVRIYRGSAFVRRVRTERLPAAGSTRGTRTAARRLARTPPSKYRVVACAELGRHDLVGAEPRYREPLTDPSASGSVLHAAWLPGQPVVHDGRNSLSPRVERGGASVAYRGVGRPEDRRAPAAVD